MYLPRVCGGEPQFADVDGISVFHLPRVCGGEPYHVAEIVRMAKSAPRMRG